MTQANVRLPVLLGRTFVAHVQHISETCILSLSRRSPYLFEGGVLRSDDRMQIVFI